MTPELATAFARETVDAIRRANAPILGNIVQLTTDVATKANHSHVDQVSGDVLALRKALDEALDECRGGLAVLQEHTHDPDPAIKELYERVDAVAADTLLRLKALELKCEAMVDECTMSYLAANKRLLEQIVEARTAVEGQIAPTVQTMATKVRSDMAAAIEERLQAIDAASKKRTQEAIDAVMVTLSDGFATMREDALKAVSEMRGPPGEGFHYREVYDPETAYGVGDWVTHDATLWAAVAPSQGMVPGTPAAAVAWRMALKRPRDGANGVGWNWRGIFAAGESYRLNDVVRHGGRVFLCRRSTTATPPDVGATPTAEWALVLE